MSRPGSSSAFCFREKRCATGLVCVCLTLVVTGCETAQQSAPPIATLLGAKASAGDLAAGREIFVMKCTRCHSVQPIGKYSVARWRGIVDDMSARANLSAAQKAQLLAYIAAARETMP